MKFGQFSVKSFEGEFVFCETGDISNKWWMMEDARRRKVSSLVTIGHHKLVLQR